MGFWPVERDAAPEGIRSCEQYRAACPASATLMCLTLR
jgi:hypothetical protein